MRTLFILALAFILSATNLLAETTRYEFSAVSKIFALSKDVITGPITLGVVYDPKKTETITHLESIQKIVGNSFKGPKNDISILPIPASDIDSQISNVEAIFATPHLTLKDLKKLKSYTIEKRLLSISTDPEAVRNGYIVIGVEEGSKNIRITMNRNLYKEAGLLFDVAFQFIVKEI